MNCGHTNYGRINIDKYFFSQKFNSLFYEKNTNQYLAR